METNVDLSIKQHNRKLLLADAMLSRHEFGDGVSVVDQDSWDTNDDDDWVAILYVNFDDQDKDSDTTKVSFHVIFNSDHEVTEAYALEHKNGEMLGSQPNPQLEIETKRPKLG